MNQKYEISVICYAYNHEKYIRRALESFVNQRVNVPFKVIVHDDASIDRTAEIIREYAEKYPSIIYPILQSENQYSKGVYILKKYIAKHVDTKYIAVCEGDDYWSDDNKLQIQFDYMESHPEVVLCVHDTERISEQGEQLNLFFNGKREDTEYTADEVIRRGGGGLFHTSSFFWRASAGLLVPDEFKIKGIGDYSQAIYLASLGNVHYIGKVMSMYRTGSINSWVSRTTKDKEKLCNHYYNQIDGLLNIDQATSQRYHASINYAISTSLFKIAAIRADYSMVKNNKELNDYYKKQPIITKLKFIVKCCLKKVRLVK